MIQAGKTSFKLIWLDFKSVFITIPMMGFLFTMRLLTSWVLLPFQPLILSGTINNIFWSVQLTLFVLGLIVFGKAGLRRNTLFWLLSFALTLALAHRGF